MFTPESCLDKVIRPRCRASSRDAIPLLARLLAISKVYGTMDNTYVAELARAKIELEENGRHRTPGYVEKLLRGCKLAAWLDHNTIKEQRRQLMS